MKKNKIFKGRRSYMIICLSLTAFLACLMDSWSRAGAAPLPALDEKAFYSALSEMVEAYEQTGLTAQSEVSDPYIAKRLILKSSNPAVDPEDYGAIAAIRDRNGLYILQFHSMNAARRAEIQLKKKSTTVYVEPDVIITANSNMTIYSIKNEQSWRKSVEAIGADVLGAAVQNKSGTVKVAVLDTGIAYSAPDLTGRIDRDNAISMLNGYSPNQDEGTEAADIFERSHGTHIAGIVAKCTEKVSDKVKILPVRVLDNYGEGYMSIASSGIRYAADHGARVINLSLSSSSAGHLLREAILYANGCGCSVVTAAGNENKSTLKCHPSNLEECIVVGAVDDSQDRAGFSNYGSTVDVMAPGVNVYSCVIYKTGNDPQTNWYAELSGTSIAAPHVSGAAAMLLLAYPAATPMEIERILQLSAKDLGAAGKDDLYGYGMVDLNTAVQQSSSLRKQAAEYLDKKEADKKAAEEAAWKDAQTPIRSTESAIIYADSNPRANTGGIIPMRRGQKSSALKVIGLGVNDSVTSWTSSDSKIVSVSGSGNGTCVVSAGQKDGSAVINAVTASGAAVSFRIKVQKKKVSINRVSVAAKSVVLRPGQTYDLQAAPYPITAQGSVKCSSSKKSVATVSSRGFIIAKKAGIAVITVKCGKKSTRVKVRIVPS